MLQGGYVLGGHVSTWAFGSQFLAVPFKQGRVQKALAKLCLNNAALPFNASPMHKEPAQLYF